jgi:type IV pilus assembly protein PilY1
MASAGGGKYYPVYQKDELLTAFNEIIGSILDSNSTFVSSGLTVNQYNRLTHNSELYYSLFRPTTSPVWEGNVKRYALNGGQIVDVDGDPAINSKGEFYDDAKSWWATDVDGNNVIKGGVVDQLQPGRLLYTNIDTASSTTSSSNRISLSNSLVTASLLGAANNAERDEIVEWALGYDLGDASRTTAHRVIGDPLHSRPTVVAYNDGSITKSLVYVGTNNGYLFSFDTSNGKEQWAFIPQELLHLMKHTKDNNSFDPHKYGMDGEISIYIDGDDGDGVVEPGEKAYLYVGMRRGGSSYYAFDISDPSKPELMFTITPSTSGFAKLGQTWSRPVVTRMNIGGVTNRLVMVFGGGYDPDVHDIAATAPTAATKGNTVYIADAKTGTYLWSKEDATQASGSAGPISAMNSVASHVKVLDLDNDKLADHFYVSDMEGQIFRFDVDNDNQTIKGGRIAKLSDPSVAGNRRFFNSPDVAIVQDKFTGAFYATVSIGSGYRAHPLDTNVEEHIYVLHDRGLLSKTFVKDIALTDLAQLNGNIGDSDNDGKSDLAEVIYDPSAPKYGWYYDFVSSGEKVLADTLTFNNTILFTTYIPSSSSTDPCSPGEGTSRIYALSLLDGQPYVDTDLDGTLDENDIYINLAGSGIAPEPQVILDGSSGTSVDPTLVVGREVVEGLLREPRQTLTPTKWRHINN